VTDQHGAPAHGDERPLPAYGDERPLPAYGEYATPEQQAAAMGLAYPRPSETTAAVLGTPPNRLQRGVAAQPRRWDLFLTSVLLAYGLWSVISAFFQYSDLSAVAQTFYTTQGIGTFTSDRPSLGAALSVVINSSDVVIFVLVAVVAFRLIRRGRVAFWVPLCGGVIATLIAGVCLSAFLFTDPSFMSYLTKLGA
jgi:hypothetical protein